MADLNQIAARIVRETVDGKAKKDAPKPEKGRISDKPKIPPGTSKTAPRAR